MDYFIAQSEEMGREMRALLALSKNRVLFEAELLVLSPEDTKVVNTTGLQYYTFKYNDTQDCLVLGDGEIFNHSDTPNIGYRLVEHPHHSGRKLMQFYVLTDVNPGEQLFIDYNADTQVNTDSYMGKNLL